MTDAARPVSPEPPRPPEELASSTGRLLALSDGIFAFAMTLLVVSLALPVSTSGADRPGLADYLGHEWPSFLAYALAFLVVVSWWTAHQRLFGCIARHDAVLLRLNNLFLLSISVTPFFMALVFTYGPHSLLSTGADAKLAVVLFGLLEVVSGSLLWGLWRYAASSARLFDPAVPLSWIAEAERYNLGRIGLFGLSVAVALVLPQVGIWLWVPVLLLRSRRRPARSPGPPAAGAADPQAKA